MPPIYNETSDLYRDERTGGSVLDAPKTHGRQREATGTVTIAADSLDGSKWKLVTVQSNAIPSDRTKFDVTNLPLANVRIGTKTNPAALVSQLQSAGNTITPFAFADANHGKAWWEVLGMASDPGQPIGLYLHAVGENASGAGSVLFRISHNE